MITRGGQARLAGQGVVGQEGDIVHFAVRTEALAEINAKLASVAARQSVAGSAGQGAAGSGGQAGGQAAAGSAGHGSGPGASTSAAHGDRA